MGNDEMSTFAQNAGRTADADKNAQSSEISENSCVGQFESTAYTGWPQKLAPFLYALTLPNINRFQNYFTLRIRRKSVIILSLEIPPHLECVATLPCKISSVGLCRSVSLIAPLVSGVAGLSASSSSKADTLNIWCKNCRMWQLL